MKYELLERVGVLILFLLDLINGKVNFLLKVMEVIVDVLEIFLFFFLEFIDFDCEVFVEIVGYFFKSSVLFGYECISVVLLLYKVFIVKKWGDDI